MGLCQLRVVLYQLLVGYNILEGLGDNCYRTWEPADCIQRGDRIFQKPELEMEIPDDKTLDLIEIVVNVGVVVDVEVIVVVEGTAHVEGIAHVLR